MKTTTSHQFAGAGGAAQGPRFDGDPSDVTEIEGALGRWDVTATLQCEGQGFSAVSIQPDTD